MVTPANLGQLEQRLWQIIERLPASGKHAARSAVFHLERAKLIAEVDPTMALFRLITAEEEAVRAIFHALQRRQYTNASRLKWRNHRHKAAVRPFLVAIMDLVKSEWHEVGKPEIYFVSRESTETLGVRVKVSIDGDLKWVIPDPPLNFSVSVDGALHDFRPEVNRLLKKQSVAKFVDLVAHDANTRNRLLYATDHGVPRFDGDIEGEYDTVFSNVFALLAVYVLIDDYQRQPFVQQALTAFVDLMRLMPADPDTDDTAA